MKYYKAMKAFYYKIQLTYNKLALQDCLDEELKRKIKNKITYYQEKKHNVSA